MSEYGFTDTGNLRMPENDIPDASKLVIVESLFSESGFNGDISKWDVGNVTKMGWMFWGAAAFDGDISKWNVSNVEDMGAMFSRAVSFKGDISKWDVGKVRNMRLMFYKVKDFNSNISKWNVNGVKDMGWMFYGAEAFNRDISGWDFSALESNDMEGWALEITKGSGMSKENICKLAKKIDKQKNFMRGLG